MSKTRGFALRLFCAFILFSSLHLSSTGFAQTFHRGDFFITATSEGLLPKNFPSRRILSQKNSENVDCRDRIKTLLCLVEPETTKGPRECLPGGIEYALPFEQIYDVLPGVLQKVFCSVDVIYIEKQFFGTAYAGTSREDGTTVVGIRKSVLDEKLNLNRWASWKEQLSFGGKTTDYEVSPVLPSIASSETPGVNSFLYFLMVHEFGHILDFANKVNDVTDSCPPETEEGPEVECDFKPEAWGALSWATTLKPQPENEFLNRAGLCFYWCKDTPLSPLVVPQVYHDLYHQTNFLSLYATTQAWDDFADSLAYYATAYNLGMSYVIDTKNERTYDIMNKLRSAKFSSKYQYIQKFLQRTDLVYP